MLQVINILSPKCRSSRIDIWNFPAVLNRRGAMDAALSVFQERAAKSRVVIVSKSIV
jgi:hypothetical protein